MLCEYRIAIMYTANEPHWVSLVIQCYLMPVKCMAGNTLNCVACVSGRDWVSRLSLILFVIMVTRAKEDPRWKVMDALLMKLFHLPKHAVAKGDSVT